MKNKLIIGIVIVALVIIVITNNKEKDLGIIKIGQSSALSGIGSDVGVEERNAALLAMKEINESGGVRGYQLQMISEDISLDKIKNTGTAFQKLINVDNVLVIVGPQYDEPAIIAARLAEDMKTPVVSATASPKVESDGELEYFFSTFYSNDIGIQRLLKFAGENGYNRIAIVQPANQGFWNYTANLMKKHAPTYGVEIVSEEYGTDFANVDYRTLIAKTKQYNPDAVFGAYADYECHFIKQMKDQGLDIPLLSTESAGNPSVIGNCGELLEGNLYFATPKHLDEYQEFELAYIEEYGVKPLTVSAVTAYDAMRVVAQAIEDADEITRESVRDQLEETNMKGYSVPRLEFNEMGFIKNDESTFEIQTVVDMEFVGVE